MAKFIKVGCTQEADVSKYLDDVKILENCKNLVPPLINSEIWNNLFPMSNKETKYWKMRKEFSGYL